MDYPTEFTPIYDQTKEQAKEMVDKLFKENAELKARLAAATGLMAELRDHMEYVDNINFDDAITDVWRAVEKLEHKLIKGEEK